MTSNTLRLRPRLKPNPSADKPPTFLTTAEAAEFLRLSQITLSRWRGEGGGPPYRKFGSRVLYDMADLIAWAAARQRRSTSEQYLAQP